MSDSQRYPLNHNLINNVNDIVHYSSLKVFSQCPPPQLKQDLQVPFHRDTAIEHYKFLERMTGLTPFKGFKWFRFVSNMSQSINMTQSIYGVT